MEWYNIVYDFFTNSKRHMDMEKQTNTKKQESKADYSVFEQNTETGGWKVSNLSEYVQNEKVITSTKEVKKNLGKIISNPK